MNHKQLAELCELSYHKSDFETPEGISFIRKETDQNHVIAIRGTEISFLDLLRNLAIWPRSLGGIDSHAGYAAGWQSIQDAVEMLCSPIKLGANNTKPVILTGHSAGGAIALIGAGEYIRKGKPISACVTFGAPKASDNESPILESITTQYIHARDPVPSWLSHTEYRHINETYIGGEKSSPWWKKRIIINGFHGIDLYKDLAE